MKKIIRKEVLDTEKYVAGKPISEVKRELGLKEVIKLASNENPLGCSPDVKKVLYNLINNTALYPDSGNFQLKQALANHYNVNVSQVFCGGGSDSLIKVLCITFLNPGDESIIAQVTFPRYESNIKLMGGICVKIPMKNNGLDVDAMVNAITDKTKMIWMCNPNNPTGSIFTKEDLQRVLDRIPKNVIIVMDEAYIEYVEDKNFPDSMEILNQYPNMITLRTFSKAYGLAGLRCGYGIANEELVGYINRVINPFDVNLFAQVAAVSALEDQDFLKEVVDENRKEREYLSKYFEEKKLEYVNSNTNFIMVNINRDDKPVYEAMLKKGVIIRPGFLLGMPQWLRISIGTKEQNRKLVQVLNDVL